MHRTEREAAQMVVRLDRKCTMFAVVDWHLGVSVLWASNPGEFAKEVDLMDMRVAVPEVRMGYDTNFDRAWVGEIGCELRNLDDDRV